MTATQKILLLYYRAALFSIQRVKVTSFNWLIKLLPCKRCYKVHNMKQRSIKQKRVDPVYQAYNWQADVQRIINIYMTRNIIFLLCLTRSISSSNCTTKAKLDKVQCYCMITITSSFNWGHAYCNKHQMGLKESLPMD